MLLQWQHREFSLPFCLLEVASMPANPPNKAINTSYTLGDVRAKSSECASLSGEIRKNTVEVINATPVATVKLYMAFHSNAISLMPIPRPMPMIGPIKGEISMAPIITAVEFTFKPSEATKMANMRIHKLVPRNITPLSMVVITDSYSSFSLPSLIFETNYSI